MKRFSRIFACLMALTVVFNLCMTAYAAGSVTYDGDANLFVFDPGTSLSPTNLFEDFQNVMPGDTVTDQIVIINDTPNKVKVKIYIRVLGAQENTDDFLSQLKLTVKKQDQTKLFEGPADETAQLKDWVCLGTLYSGGEITLNLSLEVPLTLGNEFQNKVGYLDWEFKAEEISISSSSVQTSDESNLLFFGGLLLISLLAMVALLLAWRRKKNH